MEHAHSGQILGSDLHFYQPPPEAARTRALRSLATIKRCGREQRISCEEDPAKYCFQVLSGAAKSYVVRTNGQRRIIDLLLPGDFFGFASPNDSIVLEAIVDGTTLARYPKRQIEILAKIDPQIARDVLEVAYSTIFRLQEQLLIVGHTTATGKLGSFLFRMIDRLPNDASNQVVLPMYRCDIADYLGVSVETVSRSMMGLQRSGIIALSGTRCIRVLDRAALEEFCKEGRIPHRVDPVA